MSIDERDDLLFLYAAGALEGEERDEVEGWLSTGDATIRTRLAAAEAEVATLALAQPPVPAPKAIRRRLLDRIQTAAGAGGRHSATTPGAGGDRTLGQRLAAPLLAAGLAAVAGGLLGGALARRAIEAASDARIGDLRSQLESVSRDLAALRGDLEQAKAARSELDGELADEENAHRALEGDLLMAQKAISVLSSEKAEALSLAGSGGSAARGRVVWDWDHWYCYLHVRDLAPAAGRLYALWLFGRDGEVVGLGPFESDPQGEATLVAPVPHDLAGVTRAVVSVEPDRDLTSRPRGEIVLRSGRS